MVISAPWALTSAKGFDPWIGVFSEELETAELLSAEEEESLTELLLSAEEEESLAELLSAEDEESLTELLLAEELSELELRLDPLRVIDQSFSSLVTGSDTGKVAPCVLAAIRRSMPSAVNLAGLYA